MGDGRAVSAKAFIGSVEKTWERIQNEGHFHRKRLQEQMQSFALAFAKLCVFLGNPSSGFIMVFVIVIVIVIVFVFVFVFVIVFVIVFVFVFVIVFVFILS